MRLDTLVIGSEKDSPLHQFKNLKNVSIDFDQDHWVTVLIGWNGTGKSNVLEALAIIFRDFIGKKRVPAFAFRLSYRMGLDKSKRQIHIDADPDRKKEPYIIHVLDFDANSLQHQSELLDYEEFSKNKGRRLKLNEFLDTGSIYLPRYVFSYYSGESERMHDVLLPYLKNYYQELLSGKDPGLKRLFYALPVHSQFVLLAFLIQPDDSVKDFLLNHLGIDPDNGIESVLFVLRQPPWTSKEGDPRFWNARGVVQLFLDRLMSVALAPIEVNRPVPTSMWNTNRSKREYKYLYVKDVDALRQLVGDQKPANFFRDLESTYVSELIEEVRIRVKLKKNDGSVTFRELSEGEQQLLTVLGLLRFTAEEESLFLLDEPDTHLNPRWSVDYISYLKQFVGAGEQHEQTSHILLTTHNPLAVAELVRQQVQILRLTKDEESRRVVACHPENDPRGMGYAAIVTSDMFGIASSLDHPTQLLLEQQRSFASKPKLSMQEQFELDEINNKLERLGFRFFHPDDEYSRYLRLRDSALKNHFGSLDPRELASNTVEMSRGDKEELATKLIAQLVSDDIKLSDDTAV